MRNVIETRRVFEGDVMNYLCIVEAENITREGRYVRWAEALISACKYFSLKNDKLGSPEMSNRPFVFPMDCCRRRWCSVGEKIRKN